MQLAIETTGRQGSIAILDDDTVIDSAILPSEHRTAMSLAPEIQQLMSSAGVTNKAMEIVSVAIGPGSFTGLRVGVTTAKTLSFAWEIPLVAVGSLAAIAAETFRCHPEHCHPEHCHPEHCHPEHCHPEHCHPEHCDPAADQDTAADKICVAIDAYRGQAYTADFARDAFSNAHLRDHIQLASAIDRMDLTEKVAHQSEGIRTSGDQKLFSDPTKFLTRQCDAIGVGILAHRMAKLGLWSDPMTIAPTYLKPSAAEEEIS